MLFLKHLYIKIAKPFYLTYWFIFRPKTEGVKVLIECNGSYLLVKNTYGHGRMRPWQIPGGKIEKGESREEASKREISEEVGIMLNEPLTYLGSFYTTRHYKRDTVFCYYAKTESFEFTIDPVEIAEAKWFKKNELPSPNSPFTQKIIDMYKEKPK